MITMQARNVNDALLNGTALIRKFGEERDSRNGPVLTLPLPMTTTYERPTERVLQVQERDANPFFHLYEALWMLAGENRLKFLTPIVKGMAKFSDDKGKTQPGAYGYRWRNFFNMDQLWWAVERLRADPNDRRVVIQMYDANYDQEAADRGGKDIPCNLMALPSVGSDKRLNLTVFNRSNDAVWGAYGANAVHFSVMQEYLAAQLGLEVGMYHQVSNNMHAYLATIDKVPKQAPWPQEPYEAGLVKAMPFFSPGFCANEFREDLSLFMENPATVGIRNRFLRKVACPMMMAHKAHKQGEKISAREILSQIPDQNDWKCAALMWLDKRENADGDA